MRERDRECRDELEAHLIAVEKSSKKYRREKEYCGNVSRKKTTQRYHKLCDVGREGKEAQRQEINCS